MERLMRYLVIIVLILVCVSFSQCNFFGGTETGNPTTGKVDPVVDPGDIGDADAPSSDDAFACDFCYADDDSDGISSDEPCENCSSEPPDAEDPQLTVTGNALFTICGKINECYDNVTDLACIGSIYQDLNVMIKFGANLAVHQSFETMQASIDDGELNVIDTTLNNCLDAINGLTCQSLENSNTFDESTQSYSNVYKVVPSECSLVF